MGVVTPPPGVGVGRLCVHHQPGSPARLCIAAHGTLLTQVGGATIMLSFDSAHCLGRFSISCRLRSHEWNIPY